MNHQHHPLCPFGRTPLDVFVSDDLGNCRKCAEIESIAKWVVQQFVASRTSWDETIRAHARREAFLLALDAVADRDFMHCATCPDADEQPELCPCGCPLCAEAKIIISVQESVRKLAS